MLAPAVITLALGAIILLFALMMLDELYISTGTTVTQVVNESIAGNGVKVFDKAEGYVLDVAGKCALNSITIENVINGSNSGVYITASNFTVESRTATIKLLTGEGSLIDVNNTQMNITYRYRAGDNAACTAANSTIFGERKFADYYDLIVLAIVIAVIVSLILVIFSFAGKRQ